MSGSKVEFKIVGIGASSGGLNAVRALLKALPAKTGCAFLLVQHLDPVHESMLVELLSGDTHLTVVQAVDGVGIEPEHMYVIPPGYFMSVEAGNIRLTHLRERHGARLPFDFLLSSMAKEYGALAISVVLSGSGADGSGAIGTIKETGGLVLIQDPNEAEFDGMPRSAISQAVNSDVLPVASIADAIINYQQEFGRLPANPRPVVTTAHLPEIIELLKSSTPNDFSSYKYGTLQRRIEKRLAMLDIPEGEIEQYIAILRNSEEERQNLARDLLINVTGFFRDPKVFDFLREKIIPEILLNKMQGDTVRIWVAGCSTGEEAYSLAVLFLDRINAMGYGIKLQIFASDADAEAVAVAREGHYSLASTDAIPSDLLQSYFTRSETGYSVTPQVRGSVIFTVQNVLSDPPFSRIDLVSCRNLLIYLETEAQAKVLALFSFALRESGILLIGRSETVGRMDDRFKLISKSERVYRRVGHRGSAEFRFNLASGDAVRLPNTASRVGAASRQNILSELVSHALLGRYVPAAILINRRYEYLYSIGPTEKFLQIAPGPASLDLFAIIPKSLRNKIRSAIFRAGQDQKTFVVNGAKADINGAKLQFGIHVELLSNQGEELFLICFVEETAAGRKIARPRGSHPEVTRVSELEHELDETRAELEGAIRNLEIASEEQKIITAEALSLNEEYQSTNEELVTSKEELQSLNEELTALNNQLHETLERQRAISNDLENVLYSTDVPTLFLDRALNIRFFTPATRLLFNVIPSDVGRPFSDLSMLMVDPDLRSDAVAALKMGDLIDKEVAARDGRWYIRRIKPFRTEQGSTEGVVITFIDMSAQRQISEDRETAKKSAEHATEAKSHFLAAASHDLRQPLQTLKLLQGLLEKSVEDGQSRIFVKRMGETLASMSGILNTVLDINQIEAGMVQVKSESFSIDAILVRLLEEFSYQASAKGLDLRVLRSGLAVHTDPRLLEQIVRNLLSNALKYTPTGKILLGCRRRGGKLRIEVWDTGIGIPENQIADVFKEYHRLDVPPGSGGQGLGLGLSIVKRLSDLLDLNVSVRSQARKGSVFSIDIERAVAGEALVTVPAPSRQVDNSNDVPAASILVIEDEDGMRELLRIGLEQIGHIVVATGSAVGAIEIIRDANFVPDVILADYNLSQGLSGLETIEEIRGIVGRQIPALILTGDISSNALRKYAQKKIPHINKPAKLREVIGAIHDLLGYRQETEIRKVEPAIKADPDSGRLIEIIDDDKGVRDNVQTLFNGTGWSVASYISAEDYLSRYSSERRSCLLIDAYLPGMNGLELLRVLRERGDAYPIIVITGHSDVAMAVEAMKRGAVDFIEKPFSAEEIHTSVERAFELSRNHNEQSEQREAARAKLGQLTRRQSQILERIVAGEPNKIIAAEMKLSQRTVENHRASIMRRTGSSSLSMLLRLVAAAEK
ncbi:CheR family methyltransferase [Neorhizobium alkalisoli]|uniref:histidine kinase n=1 Tax=Neorhizobium alkalisoli TaxID=528178 RepID=A0A561QCJ6_9HYPH|nr:CheR family methyltransferase [Neorhizobium alkalisoli]TWF48087.1 two-component system CheB/CheR fusion protein [Neorhizobium alkalisoli]